MALKRSTFALAVACSALTGAAFAETVTYDCQPTQGEDICRSHWKIDADARRIVDDWWCDPTPPEAPTGDAALDDDGYRNVEATAERITFDEPELGRHYDFDRATGRMTLTETHLDGGSEQYVSICWAS